MILLAGSLELKIELLHHTNQIFERPEEISVVFYRLSKADFSDYLTGYQNRALGCEDTVTFDRKLRHHEGFSSI